MSETSMRMHGPEHVSGFAEWDIRFSTFHLVYAGRPGKHGHGMDRTDLVTWVERGLTLADVHAMLHEQAAPTAGGTP